MIILKKIISGGQIGADQAGLSVAFDNGFETGGWAPRRYMTKEGPNPDLLRKFGLKEHKDSGYPQRTYQNVFDSNGTIRLAINFQSPGEKCTLKAIKFYKKPYIDVDLLNPIDQFQVIKWIYNNNIQVLNVAGNANTTKYNIYNMVYNYLDPIMKKMKGV